MPRPPRLRPIGRPKRRTVPRRPPTKRQTRHPRRRWPRSASNAWCSRRCASKRNAAPFVTLPWAPHSMRMVAWAPCAMLGASQILAGDANRITAPLDCSAPDATPVQLARVVAGHREHLVDYIAWQFRLEPALELELIALPLGRMGLHEQRAVEPFELDRLVDHGHLGPDLDQIVQLLGIFG